MARCGKCGRIIRTRVQWEQRCPKGNGTQGHRLPLEALLGILARKS